MPTKTVRSRLNGDREREILRAAFDLLGEVGYDGLRFDAVADRARASKATLYRHWPDKARLVAEAVRCCKAGEVAIPDTGDLRGDLLALLTVMAENMTGEDGPLLAGLVMAMRADPELADQMRSMYEDKNQPVFEICERARGRGEPRAANAAGLVIEIAPAVLFLRGIARGEPLDDPYVAHVVDDILLPLLTRC
jgi:AcrR family transcriptional regulator